MREEGGGLRGHDGGPDSPWQPTLGTSCVVLSAQLRPRHCARAFACVSRPQNESPISHRQGRIAFSGWDAELLNFHIHTSTEILRAFRSASLIATPPQGGKRRRRRGRRHVSGSNPTDIHLLIDAHLPPRDVTRRGSADGISRRPKGGGGGGFIFRPISR